MSARFAAMEMPELLTEDVRDFFSRRRAGEHRGRDDRRVRRLRPDGRLQATEPNVNLFPPAVY